MTARVDADAGDERVRYHSCTRKARFCSRKRALKKAERIRCEGGDQLVPYTALSATASTCTRATGRRGRRG